MYQSSSALKTATLDASSSDAMLNEGGFALATGCDATTVPAGLVDAHMAWPEVFGHALPMPQLVRVPAAPRELPYRSWDRAAGKRLIDFMETDRARERDVFGLASRMDTHMNRTGPQVWWYWPTLSVTAAVAIGAFVFAVSVSDLGAGIALMLRKLI